MEKVSAATARRIALAAQGFATARPAGRVDRRHLRKVFDAVGLIQVDSVNVLVRTEELPVFARLGPHRRDLLRAMEADGELFEYWGHEASLIPVELEPVLRWKMARAHEDAWRHYREMKGDPAFLDAVEAELRERGPLRAGELTGKQPRSGTSWWGWDRHKSALEYLFWCGRISAKRQGAAFERVYDVPERIIPAEVRAIPTPSVHDARKQLLLMAARHVGVGTAKDLADYHRQPARDAALLLGELVEEGRLLTVDVEGWRHQGYLHPAARTPRKVLARALLSPFDSLIWERARTERMWDFRYRIEIYVPSPKRVHGYYVLPFLLDEKLVARVDLKSDRSNAALLVRAAYLEAGADTAHVARPLAEELKLLAQWLGLETVTVERKGDLAAALSKAI
jgi:uncharacterized protein YcaQ